MNPPPPVYGRFLLANESEYDVNEGKVDGLSAARVGLGPVWGSIPARLHVVYDGTLFYSQS
ncbi:MAG: hypothetical protein ABSG57_08780 [Candidatus Bathyarchaeia archaeon]|jgi:hypothetical protein